ncbi:MAG: hypothetical protein GY861_17905 [bacterium]|nr:hypothetical protein [bacterium]
MAYQREEFETTDNLGSSEAFSGTATTSVANVPAVADKVISGISIWNKSSTELQVSFDGGSTFHDHDKKAFMSHNVKGEPTQIQVKTASGTADYKMIINFEVY